MPAAFLGNFDCEYDWASADNSLATSVAPTTSANWNRAKRNAAQFSSGLEAAWIALADEEDVILSESGLHREHFRHLIESGIPVPKFSSLAKFEGLGRGYHLVPWGWTDSAFEFSQSLIPRETAGTPIAARLCNSRAFRFRVERELGLDLPGSQLVDSVADLESAVENLPHGFSGWILKGNFGTAGREAIRGQNRDITGSQAAFVTTRREASGPLVFEPYLDPLAEAGIQFQIANDGQINLIGVTENQVIGGTWKGSRFSTVNENAWWHPALANLFEVAERVHSTGYHGPLGIDVMQYRDLSGNPRLRPLQDLNARYTMGRIALGWARLGRQFSHFSNRWLVNTKTTSEVLTVIAQSQQEMELAKIRAALDPSPSRSHADYVTRVLLTTPVFSDYDRPKRISLVFAAQGHSALSRVETAVLENLK